MGCEVPGHRPKLAGGLGTPDRVFDYPPEIRKVIYTTNAIESLNASLRKLLKNRGAFPNDEAIVKVIYLAMKNVEKKWTMPIQDWKRALNHFAILFGDRVTL